MKVKVSADTADFKKGMQQSASALKDLDKVGQSALSGLGEAFGVNTSKVGELGNAVKGLGLKMQQASSVGVSSFGGLLASIAPVGAAIAGLGVGALTVGFKALKDEADNFKQTLNGINIEGATIAYIETFKQALHDANKDVGESAANAESGWKKFWGTLGAKAKAYFTSAVLAAGGASEAAQKSLSETTDLLDDANNTANQAADDAAAINDESIRWLKQSGEIAKLEAQIAQAKEKTYDTQLSIDARMAAYAEWQKLVDERSEKEIEHRTIIRDLIQHKNSLVENGCKDTEAEYAAIVAVEQAIAAQANAHREGLRVCKSITGEYKKQKETLDELLTSLVDDQIAHFRIVPEWMSDEGGQPLTPMTLPNKLGVTSLGIGRGGYTIEAGLAVHTEGVEEAKKPIFEWSEIVFDATASMSDAIGGLIGDLINGEDAWSNFGQAALSAFANMAKKVGEIILAEGIGILMAKKALTSLNPGGAIAAGIALITIAAATKAALSNAASGGGAASSYSSSSASSGYSGSSGMYQQSEVEIKVTGTLKGEGSALVAVLNNEENRRYHTT